MQQRRQGGDIHGPSEGDVSAEDFRDWDNPEDFDEGEPEGYYDEDEDEGYVPTPDDPDYDLSEAAGYADWEAPEHRGLLPPWVITLISVVLVLVIVLGVLSQAL